MDCDLVGNRRENVLVRGRRFSTRLESHFHHQCMLSRHFTQTRLSGDALLSVMYIWSPDSFLKRTKCSRNIQVAVIVDYSPLASSHEVRVIFFRGQVRFRIMEIIRDQFTLGSKFEAVFFSVARQLIVKCTQLQLYKTGKNRCQLTG